MKLFRFILLPLLLFCGHLFAANPSYKNFDPNFFTVAPDGTTITLVPGIFQGSTSGIPVFNGVGTNTTIRGGLVIANLAGSTNLYNVPQTLYVRTNGNNATGVRGAPELAWSTLNGAASSALIGDTIQLLGQVSGTGTIYVTNVVLKGNGQLTLLSNSVASPCLLVSNVWLQDLWLTNVSPAANMAVLGNMGIGGSGTSNAYPIFIRNLRVQTPSIAALFDFSKFAPGPPSIDVRDSIFEGGNEAFEVWGAHTLIDGCRLTASSHGFTEAFVANDASTNTLRNCVIEAFSNTNANGNTCAVLFQASWSEFDSCLFRVDKTTNAPGVDCAVTFVEDQVTGIFNDCFFQLSPNGFGTAPLCLVNPSTTSGKLEFNNCFYWPQTNGVVVDNNNASVFITVRGGNLKRSNFSHPELVSWADTVVSTNVDISYVLNSSSNVVLDANNFILKDGSGLTVVQFGINKILGVGGQISVDWANRELDDSATSPALQWETHSLVGTWTAGNLIDSGLSVNTLVGASATKQLKSLTIGGGLTFDGTTLAATGGGSGIPGTNSVIAFGSAPNTNYSFETVIGLGETNSDGSLVLLSRGVAYATRGFTGPSLTLTNGPISTSANSLSNTISFNPSNAMTFAVGSSANASNILSLTNSLGGLFAHLYAPLDISSFANASRMVLEDSTRTLVSATASGAVPIDADGTATTAGQLQALGIVTTNDQRGIGLRGLVSMGSAVVSNTLIAGGIQATGLGPSFSWTNSAAANSENGWINNSAMFTTNPATGIWYYNSNGLTLQSNAITADWTLVSPNSLIQSNGASQARLIVTNGWATLLSAANRIDLSTLASGSGITNGTSLQQGGAAQFSSWVDVAGSLQSTGAANVFLFRRQMGMTNAIGGANSSPIDFSIGNYVYLTTNNNFSVSGFKNYTNGWVNWQTVSYSNSDSSAHTFGWTAGLVQFGTNTGTSVSVPAGKVWKGTFSVDPHGTNLYGATQSN